MDGRSSFRGSQVSRILLLTIAAAVLTRAGSAAAQDGQVYRISVTGVIELGLAPYVGRVLADADAAGAQAVVLDLDTPGGRVDAAQQIVKSVVAAEVPVYAFVNPHAWSAGALIALAADSIFMAPGSSIGAATPVTGAGEKAPEKIVSAMRSEFRALAERRGLDPRVAEAMVDEDVEIEDVVEAGKLLTLTAAEAEDVGVSEGEIASLDALLVRVGLEGADVESPGINWAEQLVRFLSHPVVSPLLLSVGMLGLLIEIKSPSFGIAGITGALALAAFFGSHLIIGLAGWEELILLAAGLVALGIEVFVVPGFGVAGVLSILLIGSAVFLALLGSLPTWADVARASGVVSIALGLVIAGVYLLVRELPARQRWRGVFLRAATDRTRGYISAPVRSELVGSSGVAATDLRPSGVAVVNGERIDVVSETGFVAKGTLVKVTAAESYRHVVTPLEPTPT